MRNNMHSIVSGFFADKARRRKLTRLAAVLSVVVAAGVFWRLTQPVITLTPEPVCGQTEHVHSADCYRQALTCGLEEGDDHTHGEDCYASVLSCGMAEHSHDDACYPAAMAEPTLAPTGVPAIVEETGAPVEATEVPVEPTDMPAEPTDIPVEPTDIPVEPTDIPAEAPVLEHLSASAERIFVGQTVVWQFDAADADALNYIVSDAAGQTVSEGALSASDRQFAWTPELAGDYTVTLVATNSVGSARLTGGVTVEEAAELTASVWTDACSCFAGDSVDFHMTVSGGAALTAFEVTISQDGELLATQQSASDSITVTPADPGRVTTLTARLTVADELGATATSVCEIPVALTTVGDASKWAQAVEIPLGDRWPENLVRVAETQLGYHESDVNFIVRSDGSRQGYTLYGEWYGMPYEEWCAMFASYCLERAGISEADFPRCAGCDRWIEALRGRDLYVDAGVDRPAPGDLIFFDWDGDRSSDHVGIVAAVTETTVETIEGNSAASVRRREYAADDRQILGYGLLNRAYEAHVAALQPETAEALPALEENLVPEAADANITVTFVIDNPVYTNDPGSGNTHLTVTKANYQSGMFAAADGLTFTSWASRYKVTGTGTLAAYAIPAGTSLGDNGYALAAVTVENIGSQNTYTYVSPRSWVDGNGTICNTDTVFDADTTLHLSLYQNTENYNIDFRCCGQGAHSVTYMLGGYPSPTFKLGESISAPYIPSAEAVNAGFNDTEHELGAAYGKVFTGWYLVNNADGSHVEFGPGVPLTADYVATDADRTIRVYADWTDAVSGESATVSFVYLDPDTAEPLTVAESRTAAVGETIALPAQADLIENAYPAGHFLTGWQVEDGNGQWTAADDPYTVAGDVTLYAQFEAPVRVTFRYLDGTADYVVPVRAGATFAEVLAADPALPAPAETIDVEGVTNVFINWTYVEVPEGATDGVVRFASDDLVIAGDMTFTAGYGEPTHSTLVLHDVGPDGRDYSDVVSIPAQPGQTLRDALKAVNHASFNGLPGTERLWYTRNESGEKVPFGLDAEVTSDLELYAYTYRIVLQLGDSTARTASNSLMDALFPRALATTVVVNGNTMTITLEEGQALKASDLVYNGVDYSLYTGTIDGSTVSLSTLIGNSELTARNITVTNLSSDMSGYGTHQFPTNFYVFVDDERELLRSPTVTAYKLANNDNRYYISANLLESVYADYGFEAESLTEGTHYFPHTDAESNTIWADASVQVIEVGGKQVGFSPILNHASGSCDVYYLPKQTVTNSAGYSDEIWANTFYSITVKNADGDTVRTEYVLTGENKNVTVDDEPGYAWKCKTSSGADSNIEGTSENGQTTFAFESVDQAYVIQTEEKKTTDFVIRAVDVNGGTTCLAEHIPAGESRTVVLDNADGYEWFCDDAKGVVENGTTTFTFDSITQDLTIRQQRVGGEKYYYIVYDTNYGNSSYPAPYNEEYAPLVDGAKVYEEAIPNDFEGSYSLRRPNPDEYNAAFGEKYKLEYSFVGWTSNGSAVTQEALTAEELAALADSDGVVRLDARWLCDYDDENAKYRKVNFFVMYNCEATSVQDNAAQFYTDSVYGTELIAPTSDPRASLSGGMTEDYKVQQIICAPSGNTVRNGGGGYTYNESFSAACDEQIRKLADEGGVNGNINRTVTYNGSTYTHDTTGTNYKIASFPSDDYVFAQLRKMQEDYLQAYNAWLAENSSKTASEYIDNGAHKLIVYNGQPVPVERLNSRYFTIEWYVFKYDATDCTHIDGRLKPRPAKLTITKTFYGDPASIVKAKHDFNITVTGDKSYDGAAYSQPLTLQGDGNTYTWTLDDLRQDVTYHVQEHNYIADTSKDYLSSAEYIVTHSETYRPANQWRRYSSGTSIDVTATSYLESDSVQTVNLVNSYVPEHTMLVHKINGETGSSLSGVTFRLKQNGQTVMLYYKDGIYHLDQVPDAASTETLTTDAQGRILIGYAEGSQALEGTYTLEETAGITGYDLIDPITFTVTDGANGVQITTKSGDATADGLQLTVKNQPQTTHVTLRKNWTGTARPVEIELYRRSESGDVKIDTARLDDTSGWKCEWENLPLYDGNEPTVYTARETKIGDTSYDQSIGDPDGFQNYVVTVGTMYYEDVNGNRLPADIDPTDERVHRAVVEVSNRLDTGEFTFRKRDANDQPLGGATFALYSANGDVDETTLAAQLVDGSYVLDGEAFTQVGSATSQQSGQVSFGNVPVGTYYMVEARAPQNYAANPTVYKVVITKSGSTITAPGEGVPLTAIDNGLAQVDVTLTKKYGETPLAGAIFAIYGDPACTGEPSYTMPETAADGTATLSLPVGTWYMKETTAPAGYLLSDSVYTLVVSPNGTWTVSLDGSPIDAIQNVPDAANVTVVKVDDQGNPLGGATFELRKDGELCPVNGTESAVFSPDNQTTLVNLAAGNYTIRETVPPAGYYGMAGSISFTIANGAVVVDKDALPDGVTYDAGTFTVKNVPGVELPHTGGSGEIPYAIGGLLLMAVSLLCGYRMRRGRGREVGAR